jgi:hypothetical protein
MVDPETVRVVGGGLRVAVRETLLMAGNRSAHLEQKVVAMSRGKDERMISVTP